MCTTNRTLQQWHLGGMSGCVVDVPYAVSAVQQAYAPGFVQARVMPAEAASVGSALRVRCSVEVAVSFKRHLGTTVARALRTVTLRRVQLQQLQVRLASNTQGKERNKSYTSCAAVLTGSLRLLCHHA
jgi:hypothetical protein